MLVPPAQPANAVEVRLRGPSLNAKPVGALDGQGNQMMSSRYFVLCLLAAVLSLSARPMYPTSPHGLRRLYLGAELVVVAEVICTEPLDPEKPWGASKATLDVLRCLKGDLDGRLAEVHFEVMSRSCTPSAHYGRGQTVLAFLVPRVGASGYSTFARRYGAKALQDGELEVYLDRIEELTQLLSISDTDERSQQTAEWMVRCVEHPATRRDGYNRS
ncbi:MAG: hypothetical protein ACI9EF_001401 [Pseudohongiellaceae bacterium]|jgi:hypothetical protein